MSNDIRKILNLFEARDPDIEYQEKTKEVIAKLVSHTSGKYTKIAKTLQKIELLTDELSRLKEEIKQATREDVAVLFDAEDSVKTRVVETLRFTLVLSKDPAPSETVQYAKVLKELENDLTPELYDKLQTIKKQYTTIVTKAPSLRYKDRTVTEGVGDTVASWARAIGKKLKDFIDVWGKQYDKKLDNLKKMVDM